MTEINKNQARFCLKNSFKKFSPSKTFIALTFTLLGISSILLVQNIAKAHEHRDPFFNIFAEMEEMQKNMDQLFANHQKHMREIFDAAQKNDKTNKSKVSTREDKDAYYYELSFSGFKKEDISVQIKDQVLTFSAQKNDEKTQETSNFHYSFLAPQLDAKKEPEIIRLDDKLFVKLWKKSAKS